MKTKQIEFNDQFKTALEIMGNTSNNVFVTGKAGTGKSTLLDYFRSVTKKNIVVLAPTGVAAVNVEGETIHSFFRFKPGITILKVKKFKNNKIYKALDAIIIDEISMVRADLLDCIDKFLRLNGENNKMPFGGVQMIFIGDLYQLPPVVTSNEKKIFAERYKSEYFFDADVYKDIFKMDFVELEKVYRQKDENFIQILNAIRNNSVTNEELEIINGRYMPDFKESPDDFYVYLTPTNKASQEINETKLNSLHGEIYEYSGEIYGDFGREYLPTETELKIKIGAQVMLLNNDSLDRWINGTIGKIVDIVEKGKGKPPAILVEIKDGKTEEVLPHKWEIFNFEFDKEKNTIKSEVIGSFTQYPIKLAWSVTIHKSQGKTFDNLIIDIGRGTFTCGQMYVALSRCTSLKGIALKKKINKNNIWADWRIVDFLTKYQYKISDEKCPIDDKVKILENAVINKKMIEIVYLKTNDMKTRRKILPNYVGELEYNNESFLGVKCFCYKRNEERAFRVDRILEIT